MNGTTPYPKTIEIDLDNATESEKLKYVMDIRHYITALPPFWMQKLSRAIAEQFIYGAYDETLHDIRNELGRRGATEDVIDAGIEGFINILGPTILIAGEFFSHYIYHGLSASPHINTERPECILSRPADSEDIEPGPEEMATFAPESNRIHILQQQLDNAALRTLRAQQEETRLRSLLRQKLPSRDGMTTNEYNQAMADGKKSFDSCFEDWQEDD